MDYWANAIWVFDYPVRGKNISQPNTKEKNEFQVNRHLEDRSRAVNIKEGNVEGCFYNPMLEKAFFKHDFEVSEN